jgi:hypothetical protein
MWRFDCPRFPPQPRAGNRQGVSDFPAPQLLGNRLMNVEREKCRIPRDGSERVPGTKERTVARARRASTVAASKPAAVLVWPAENLLLQEGVCADWFRINSRRRSGWWEVRGSEHARLLTLHSAEMLPIPLHFAYSAPAILGSAIVPRRLRATRSAGRRPIHILIRKRNTARPSRNIERLSRPSTRPKTCKGAGSDSDLRQRQTLENVSVILDSFHFLDRSRKQNGLLRVENLFRNH